MQKIRGFVLVLVAALFTTQVRDVASVALVRGLPDWRSVPDQNTGRWHYYDFNVTDNKVFPSVCDCEFVVTQGAGTLPDPFLDVVKNTDANEETHWELWTHELVDYQVANTGIEEVTCMFTCDDSFASTQVANLTIRFSQGETVFFDNFKDSITVNAKKVDAGEELEDIDAISSLVTRDFNYEIVHIYPSFSPDAPEFITIDPNSGKITTTQDLVYFDTGKGTSMEVVVKAFNQADGMELYKRLEIYLTDQNHPPYMVNLLSPGTETVSESVAAGDIIWTGTCEDADGDVTPLPAISSCTPSPCDTIFVMDAKGNLKVDTGQSLDYESARFYEFEFTCEDNYMINGPYTLELSVTNDNDAPVCPDTMHYVTIYEEQTATWDPALVCTDEDAGDTLSWELDPANSSSRFNLASANQMSLAVPYDIDNGAFATSVIVTANCVDNGGFGGSGTKKTCTTQITVTIEDVNDNCPEFSDPYTFYFNQWDDPGDILGSVLPTDADSTSNGQVACATVSTSNVRIDQNCNVRLITISGVDYGDHIPMTVTAQDNGVPSCTSTAVVDVYYIEATTTTTTTVATTTTTESSIWDEPGMIALLVLLGLLGAILLGLLSWCLARLCCGCGKAGGGRCCQGTSKRMVFPQRYMQQRQPTYRMRKVLVKTTQQPSKTQFSQPPSYNQAIGNQKFGPQNFGNQSYGPQNFGNQGYGTSGYGTPGYGNQNFGTQNLGNTLSNTKASDLTKPLSRY